MKKEDLLFANATTRAQREWLSSFLEICVVRCVDPALWKKLICVSEILLIVRGGPGAN
jgi:hypothetical protein